MADAKKPFTPDELLAAFRYYFAIYCREENVSKERLNELNPTHFLAYLEEVDDDLDDLPTSLNRVACQFVLDIPDLVTGSEHLMAVWPYLVLRDRSNQHKLASVNLALLLTFVDGTVSQSSVFAHKDVTYEDLNDATVVGIVSAGRLDLSDRVTTEGLDNLHDVAKENEYIVDQKALDFLDRLVAASRDVCNEVEFKRLVYLVAFLRQLFPAKIPVHLMKPECRYADVPQPTKKPSASTDDD
jgi:hypothetical protein